MNSIITMEPYLSKHRLKEYDNALIYNIIMKTKQKSLQLQACNIDTWWNLIHDMFQTDLQTLFDEHKANEASYKRRFKAYKEAYPKFKYDSSSTTPKNSFNTSNFNQYEASPSGEAYEVQSSPPIESRGGDTIEEGMDEQIVAQFEEQVLA